MQLKLSNDNYIKKHTHIQINNKIYVCKQAII